MALDAIRDAREAWPDAEIDLAVGHWNQSLAALIPGVSHVDLADAPWLVRAGESRHGWSALLAQARRWRRREAGSGTTPSGTGVGSVPGSGVMGR